MEYAACAWRAGRGVCRCCLSEGCYKDIATEYYWMGERELYQDMLRECFDLTISYQDGGTNSNSRLICEVCITRLRDASNFKKQVINAEKRFAEHILTGSKLSDITEAAPAATFQEVKLEGVKDETGISDDDDMGADEAATDDPDYDPDYDESDMLPLKFEVQKKEALVEFSFGDEMPTLNTNETTIRRVSKSKGKSPSKKIKMSKKELTIKPIKASGSKVAKVPKAPKPAKVPVKKGHKRISVIPTDVKVKIESGFEPENSAPKSAKRIKPTRNVLGLIQKDLEVKRKRLHRKNVTVILECSTACPFKWRRSTYICFYCSTAFLEPERLREHTYEKHTSNDKLLKKIQHNEVVKIDVTILNCKLCGAKFETFDALKTHLSASHDKVIDATYGDGVLPYKLTRGEQKCQVCGLDFSAFLMLNQHMNSHYQNFICETCGKGFVTAQRLQTHARTHERGTFECPQCELQFASRSLRHAHVDRIHRAGRRYKCTRCPEKFVSYYERVKHLRVVHGEKTTVFQCPVCPRVFDLCSRRTTHIKLAHLQERNHLCTVCGMKFFRKFELRDHMVRHGGERIYQCDICKKSYARIKTLREHMRIHNNDRRFVCTVCGQAFVQNCSLKQHMKVHHPGI